MAYIWKNPICLGKQLERGQEIIEVNLIDDNSSSNREISDTLHDLVSFVQFKKIEKHPWRSVTFSKVAGF